MTTTRRQFLFGASLATFVPTTVWAETAQSFGNYDQRAEVKEWAKRIAKEQDLPYDWIINQLKKAKYAKTSHKIVSKPALTSGNKPKNWYAHRKNFIDDIRINAGRLFVMKHRKLLLECGQRWHVDPAIIASIIGIETIFGHSMGNLRAIDTLSTLSFDYTRRGDFFKRELAALLQYCYTHEVDPASILGSFAGAIGMCQFMPSNISAFGVDYDKDGIIDLRDSAGDAIASVANYLRKHGWDDSLPIALECEADETIAKKLKVGSTRVNTTIEEALKAGVTANIPDSVDPKTPVMLVRLLVDPKENPKGALWRLGTKNFEAILRYNRSYFYAETVRELALEITPDDFYQKENSVTTETKAK